MAETAGELQAMICALSDSLGDLQFAVAAGFANLVSGATGVLSGLQGAIVSISALGVLITFVLSQRAAARDRQRQEYAKALQAVVKWTEMPYRIRRRVSDDKEIKIKLASQMHELQEELAFHDAWLSVEAPRVALAYQRMVARVREQTGTHLRSAWNAEVSEDDPMNLGGAGFDYVVEYAEAKAEYIREVRHHLLWLGLRGKTVRFLRRDQGGQR